MKRQLLLILLILSLTACGVESQPPVPTKTPAVTEIPTTKETITLTPTSSPTLTSTRILTFTPTPTVAPTRTPKPKADPGLLVTLGEIFGNPGSPVITEFSPDGELISLASERIRIWNSLSYELVFEFENSYHERCNVENAKFSDDGKFYAVASSNCWDENGFQNPPGHLLVWDLETGDRIFEADMEYAFMTDSKQGDFSIGVYAIVFLPNSHKLAYATGNSIAIQDLDNLDADPENLYLGHDMYATEISVRDDGEYLFVLMEWWLLRDFPAYYRMKSKLQSWHLDPNYLNFDRGFPEVYPGDQYFSLHKDNLLRLDTIKENFEVRNLTTNIYSQIPYRKGQTYFNIDFTLMVVCRIKDIDQGRIEVWNITTSEELYSFSPDSFANTWYRGLYDISFSPDNKILAIGHNEKVSLWNINSIVNPDANP